MSRTKTSFVLLAICVTASIQGAHACAIGEKRAAEYICAPEWATSGVPAICRMREEPGWVILEPGKLLNDLSTAAPLTRQRLIVRFETSGAIDRTRIESEISHFSANATVSGDQKALETAKKLEVAAAELARSGFWDKPTRSQVAVWFVDIPFPPCHGKSTSECPHVNPRIEPATIACADPTTEY